MSTGYEVTRTELDAVRKARQDAASRRCEIRRRVRAELAVARRFGLLKRHQQKAGRTMDLEPHIKAIIDTIAADAGVQARVNGLNFLKLEISASEEIGLTWWEFTDPDDPTRVAGVDMPPAWSVTVHHAFDIDALRAEVPSPPGYLDDADE